MPPFRSNIHKLLLLMGPVNRKKNVVKHLQLELDFYVILTNVSRGGRVHYGTVVLLLGVN
jgi:hypothetical protein